MSLSKIVQESVSLLKDLERQTTRGMWWIRLDRTEELLISSQIKLLEEMQKWTKQHPNSYEGEEALVFRTTMKEVSTYLQEQITKCKELMK